MNKKRHFRSFMVFMAAALLELGLFNGCGMKHVSYPPKNFSEEEDFLVGICLTGKDEAILTNGVSELFTRFDNSGISYVAGNLVELREEKADMIIAAPLAEEDAETIVKENAVDIPVMILNHMPSDDIVLEIAEGSYKVGYITYDFSRISEILDELMSDGKSIYGKCLVPAASENSSLLREIEKACKNKGMDFHAVFLSAGSEDADSVLAADNEILYVLVERTDMILDTVSETVEAFRDGKEELGSVFVELLLVTREEYEKLDR